MLKLPSVDKLLDKLDNPGERQESERVNQVSQWLLEQIDYLKKNVDKIQNEIVDRYQERLDKAHQEVTVDYEQQKSIWIPMQQKAQELVEEFSQLENFWKSND